MAPIAGAPRSAAPPLSLLTDAERFEFALRYLFENEGGFSDDPADHGGATMWGITAAEARRYGYNVRQLTRAQAALIYRADYWVVVQWITDARLAAKCFDLVVNVGAFAGAKIIQRAAGVADDGVIGSRTREALLALPVEQAIERVSQALGDYYVDICRTHADQLVFLKGWVRRAIRRPVLGSDEGGNG